jgi:ketosteroid isomerase-like protein
MHRTLLWSCAVLLPLLAGCDRPQEPQVVVDPTIQGDPAALPVGAAGDTIQATGGPGIPPELTSRSQEFVTAFNGTDPAAVAPFFTEDATAVVEDSTYRGRMEIRERYLERVVPEIGNLRLTEERTEQTGPDYVTSGSYAFTHGLRSGATPATQSGRYRAHWTRTTQGRWAIRALELRTDP